MILCHKEGPQETQVGRLHGSENGLCACVQLGGQSLLFGLCWLVDGQLQTSSQVNSQSLSSLKSLLASNDFCL
jgi:hypothetical protein